ncbi:MAG: hypothetical protein GX148_05915 [Clostridiales bacterium]|nr:hypothetical protein [Clostridiales bacterium]
MATEHKRKNAKSKAREKLSERFFTFIAGVLLGFAFCFGVFYSFRLLAFLLTAVKADLDYLFYVTVYFITFPVISGTVKYCCVFLLTGKVNLYIIFAGFYSVESFVKSLENSLLCLVALLFLLFPFLLSAAIPYIFMTPDRVTLVFEVISLFLLIGGIVYWLSFVSSGNLKREYASFYLSFLLHYVIAYFTKGIYLLFLFPYICVSFYYYREKDKIRRKAG